MDCLGKFEIRYSNIANLNFSKFKSIKSVANKTTLSRRCNQLKHETPTELEMIVNQLNENRLQKKRTCLGNAARRESNDHQW